MLSLQRNRSLECVVLAVAAVAAGPAPLLADPPPAKPPNFIFILADDLGWGDLGCYGHRHIQTPALDRLAREGVRFTQFYVCGSVCSPSRAAFLTGRFPARVRMHGHLANADQNAKRGMPNFLDPAVPTVTAILKKAGYATAHFGKWHLGAGPDAPPPTAYGIDESRCVNGNGPRWEEDKDPYFRAESSDRIIDETIRFLEANRSRPFYVNAWFLLPHATLNPTAEQLEMYKRFAPEGVPYKGATQVYYASVTAADAAVGRLLRKLDELGLAENTVVVFSSDNGPEDIHVTNASHSGVGSAGPFRGRKRSLYEGGIRVPFLVRWPAVSPANRVDDESVVAGVDWLPTVCRLAGVEVPPDVQTDGEDASEAFHGRPWRRTRSLLWDWRFGIAGDVLNKSPITAMRDGPWKLLMNPDRSRIELYDIRRDPSELQNLAKEHPDVVERMARRLIDWRKELPAGPTDDDAGSNAYPWPQPYKEK